MGYPFTTTFNHSFWNNGLFFEVSSLSLHVKRMPISSIVVIVTPLGEDNETGSSLYVVVVQ